MWKWISEYWERVIFSVFGFSLLTFSVFFLWKGSLAEASATFGMGFFSLIFASLARFKRFKGLGFEAELWEDKQKEAAELVERLKGVVSVYSREAVLSRVMMGRWDGNQGWESHWKLFDELHSHHAELGQEIDFSDLKHELDAIFIFDMASPLYSRIREPIWEGRQNAQKAIDIEFGSPISDIEGYQRRIQDLRSVEEELENVWEVAHRADLAKEIVDWANRSKDRLKEKFDVDIKFDSSILADLDLISNAYRNQPIHVTKKLISLSRREE